MLSGRTVIQIAAMALVLALLLGAGAYVSVKGLLDIARWHEDMTATDWVSEAGAQSVTLALMVCGIVWLRDLVSILRRRKTLEDGPPAPPPTRGESLRGLIGLWFVAGLWMLFSLPLSVLTLLSSWHTSSWMEVAATLVFPFAGMALIALAVRTTRNHRLAHRERRA